jgi:outer membrane lipoprotein-sorting protein
MTIFLLSALLIWFPGGEAPGQEHDPEEIVRRSIEVSQKDWNQMSDYDYVEREVDGGHSKTYQVQMMLESRYRRLIAVDDKPLSPEAEAREERLLQKALADREHETPEQRERRLAQHRKEISRQQPFVDQMLKAFHFTLLGRKAVASRDVYVVRAQPRRDYHPPNSRAKALTGMEGTLWIDATDFRWVRVEAEVKQPVSIEGFIARVELGTRFELEQRPVAEGIWLPTRFLMRTRAKVLFVFSHKQQQDSTYYGYRKSR